MQIRKRRCWERLKIQNRRRGREGGRREEVRRYKRKREERTKRNIEN